MPRMKSEPMEGVFGMMKDAAMLVKDAIFFIKDLNKSSSENILDKFVGIVTKGASILAGQRGGKDCGTTLDFPVYRGDHRFD